MARPKRLLCGVGINDSDYAIAKTVDGKRKLCPIYQVWASMIKRCHCEIFHKENPSYTECSVCDEWLIFSNFKKWMDNQDWRGKELDKDLIIKGNKVYSPETCAFVDCVVNNFIRDGKSGRGLPPGVSMHKKIGKFQARACNPINKNQEHIGYFLSEHEAHEAWRRKKHQHACMLADLQTDKRVADALRARYL